MSDIPDLSTLDWSNSGHPEPADPSSYLQSSAIETTQQGEAYGGRRNSSANRAGGDPSSDAGENSQYSSSTFGQPQMGSQSGYYGTNGVDASPINYSTANAGSYTPIDPALTSARGGQQSAEQSSYLSQHFGPSNFNPSRRYSTPAISPSSNSPYTVPRRQNLYPPQYSQHPSSDSFAQPHPRSSAIATSIRSSFSSYPAERRMSMPTSSIWQLDHQITPQQPPAPHADPRPRQHSMVDWRLSSQPVPSRSSHSSNPLLADLDASQGMLSLRGDTQWGSQDSYEEEERRGSYDPGMLQGGYDPGRRGSVDSNATQPGSVLGEGMKKHTCPTCRKRFTRPSSLQTHIYSHTGEKRKFPTPDTGEEADCIAFKCEFQGCGRSFSVVSNLRRHNKIHLS